MKDSAERYRVEICDDSQGFGQLRELWKRLEAVSPNFHLTASYDWLTCWWAVFANKEDVQFGYSKKLCILLFYEENEVVAIAPLLLVTRKKFGIPFRFIEFLGQQWGASFTGILHHPDAQDIGRSLQKVLGRYWRFDTLHLSHIPLSDPVLSVTGGPKLIPFSGCPTAFMSSFANFSEYTKLIYSKHQSHNIRTLTNKAIRNGLNYTVSMEEAHIGRLPEIRRLSQSKLIDGKLCLYNDEQKLEFMTQIIQKFASELLLVWLDGKITAYRLNISLSGWKYCLDASYDREYRLYAPGLLSLHESLKDSFARGYLVHCEGPGIDPYKAQFIPGAIPLHTIVQAGNSIFGKLSAARLRYRYLAPALRGGANARTN